MLNLRNLRQCPAGGFSFDGRGDRSNLRSSISSLWREVSARCSLAGRLGVAPGPPQTLAAFRNRRIRRLDAERLDAMDFCRDGRKCGDDECRFISPSADARGPRNGQQHRPIGYRSLRFGDDRDGGTASGAINCEGVKTLDACKPVLTSAAMSV